MEKEFLVTFLLAMEGGITRNRPRRKPKAQPLVASLPCPQGKDGVLKLYVHPEGINVHYYCKLNVDASSGGLKTVVPA